MKTSYVIDLKEFSKCKEFVMSVRDKITSDVDISYGSQIADAKSVMGVIYMCIHPVTVTIHSDDNEELQKFAEICEKYEVKDGE